MGKRGLVKLVKLSGGERYEETSTSEKGEVF
jgi:hypothetical protein